MPAFIQLKGATPSHPVRFTPIYCARFFDGLYTNRSPLRDAGSSHLEETFYGARGDGMIDGLNTEVSVRLTLVRRPGISVYNSQSFPPIDSFYEFRLFNSNVEQIKVLADTQTALFDATGPSTHSVVFNKSPGAGQTYMQSVGNTLYFGDGIDQMKWVQSLISWTPNTAYTAGEYIIDTNGNLQEAIGSQTATVIGVQIQSNYVILFFSNDTPLTIPYGTALKLSGFGGAAFLDGHTIDVTVSNSTQVFSSFTHANYGYAQDSGTATTGTGVSGGTQPVWNTTVTGITQDGGTQWLNRGSNLQKWGIVAPTLAPTVTQTPIQNIYPSWAANTWYIPTFAIEDSHGNVQILSQSGVTGGSQPSWNSAVGSATTDNTAIWTCTGPSARQPNHSYLPGYVIVVRWYTFPGGVSTYNQAMFISLTAGTTSPAPDQSIGWTTGAQSATIDGTVTWQNLGPVGFWADFGGGANVSAFNTITDSNGDLQQVFIGGKSGSSAPTWSTQDGAYTTDNTVTWQNIGPFAAANTGTWTYAYSYANSLTGAVSTASPLSLPILQLYGNQVILRGPGSTDPQVDEVYVWRTVQGGSSLFFLGIAPIIGPNNSWAFADTIPDTQLNNLISAPIAGANDPPPAGIGYLTYHLGRIWGAINNSVYYSGGPDTITGNGAEAWPASNVFVFPSSVKRLFASAIGLLVFTNSDIYLISGLGTSASPFIDTPYIPGLGLLNYNAWDVNGTTVYMFSSDLQVVSLDLTSGASEVSFPIGDKFLTGWEPDTTRVSWFISGSIDKGLYVSNNSGWYRMCPTPAPETGLTWSTFAAITAGCSAVQSVETSPGVHNLLVASLTPGPIFKRDHSVFTDNGSPYPAYSVFGSLALCQPGQMAELRFLTTEAIVTGSPVKVSVQLDEIAPINAGYFETLPNFVPDPPQLVPSQSIASQRFYFSQSDKPALCRNLQVLIDFGSDTVQNELLSMTLFGGFAQEG